MIQSNFHLEVHVFSSLVSCVFRTYQNSSKIFSWPKNWKQKFILLLKLKRFTLVQYSCELQNWTRTNLKKKCSQFNCIHEIIQIMLPVLPIFVSKSHTQKTNKERIIQHWYFYIKYKTCISISTFTLSRMNFWWQDQKVIAISPPSEGSVSL